MHQNLLHHSCVRFVHNREIPYSIDHSNGHHTLRQGCCINVFCRHICSLDFGQFHSLCTEFLLNPQVSGLHVSHAETDPSSERDRATAVNETLDLCGFTPVEENGLNKLCFGDSHCACEVLYFWSQQGDEPLCAKERTHECTIQPHHCSRGGVPRRRASGPVAVRSAVQAQRTLAWPELQRPCHACHNSISPSSWLPHSRPHEVPQPSAELNRSGSFRGCRGRRTVSSH